MPPILLSKRDDCSIRHDRPTFNTFQGLHTSSNTITFEAFQSLVPSSVPTIFLRKRYDDVPASAPLSDFEYAAKLAIADFGYRSHMLRRYDQFSTGLPPKRNVSAQTSHERRAGADKEDEDSDNIGLNGVCKMISMDNKSLFIAGKFQIAGNITANSIARYALNP